METELALEAPAGDDLVPNRSPAYVEEEITGIIPFKHGASTILYRYKDIFILYLTRPA